MTIRTKRNYQGRFGSFPSPAIVFGLSPMQENEMIDAGDAERVASGTSADGTVICVNQSTTGVQDLVSGAWNEPGTPAWTVANQSALWSDALRLYIDGQPIFVLANA